MPKQLKVLSFWIFAFLLLVFCICLEARADRIGFLISEPDGDPSNQYVLGLSMPNGSISIVGNVATYTAGAGGSVEGTTVLSTGEAGGVKFLREDGDNTSSWQTIDSQVNALIAAYTLGVFSGTTIPDNQTIIQALQALETALEGISTHTQGTDTALGALGTKNPPIDADKVIYRDSTDSDALVTSTWTEVKAFLKTYFDTLYQPLATILTNITAGSGAVDLGTANVDLGDAALTMPAASVTYAALAASAKFQSLAVADLSDATTPSVLIVEETTNKVISNYKATGADHVFTMPAAHAAGNVIFSIGDEFQVDIEPASGTNFYLNGTAMANDEHIQNTADTIGEQIVGYCVTINGTLTWMFYSSDAAWVEETP